MERRWLPGAAGKFERFGDGEKEFFGEGTADELDADGQAVGRSSDWNGQAGKSSEVEPL